MADMTPGLEKAYEIVRVEFERVAAQARKHAKGEPKRNAELYETYAAQGLILSDVRFALETELCKSLACKS